MLNTIRLMSDFARHAGLLGVFEITPKVGKAVRSAGKVKCRCSCRCKSTVSLTNEVRPFATATWLVVCVWIDPIRDLIIDCMMCQDPRAIEGKAGAAMSARDRFNVVVVVADQLRRHALGCYGDPNVNTPAIDALAASGTRFANAVSTYPICVPFRFTLMTGQYAHTRLVPSIGWRMSPAERTLADEFNEVGYDTAYFGKWHLYGGYGQLADADTFRTSRTAIPRLYRGRWQHFSGFDLCNDPDDTYYFVDDDPVVRPIGRYQTDGVFDMALAYLSQPIRRAQPFAAVVSVEPPHPPLSAPPEYARRWTDRDVSIRSNVDLDIAYPSRGPDSGGLLAQIRSYYAMIENLDDNIARLMNTLDSRGLLDTTVIVFISDHGDLLGSHGLLDKQYPYEESIGIPLIASGPTSRYGAGVVVDDPVSTEDLFPTILGLSGVEPPPTAAGADLSPLMRGETTRLNREGILLEFVDEQRPNMAFHGQPWRAVRTQRYKYTTLAGSPWQFFDLTEDPYEQRNLLEESPRTSEIKRHHGLLNAMLRETADHYTLVPLSS
jgi:arylsulfatase A-like enzyme